MERSAKQAGFARTLEFLQASTLVPLEKKPSKGFYPSKSPEQEIDKWQRNWEIAGLYAGTDTTFQDIGQRYGGLTRERVRQIFKEGVKKLHLVSKVEIQNQFPLEGLELRKPLTFVSRLRLSQAQGGMMKKVLDEARAGKTPGQIKQELDITYTQLARKRKQLQSIGIHIGYIYERRSSEYQTRIKKLKEGNLSKDKVQKLFDEMTSHIYQRLSSGENPILSPLTTVTRESGIFIEGRRKGFPLVAHLLKKGGIPVGSAPFKNRTTGKQYDVAYYFIRESDIPKAGEILNTDPRLEAFRNNPVRVFGKKDTTIPTTYEFGYSPSYKVLRGLLSELGYPMHGARPVLITSSLITDECPASIFMHQGSYRYKVEDEKVLKEFFKGRLEKSLA